MSEPTHCVYPCPCHYQIGRVRARVAELEAENKKLRGAIQPLAKLADEHGEPTDPEDWEAVYVRDLIYARDVLKGRAQG